MNEIYITHDINLVNDSEYDRNLAKCHLANWGFIYCYKDTNEPLEIEDVKNWELDK